MATTYTDQFFVMDPGNPPKSGTKLEVEKFKFTDQGDDGEISKSGKDTFDGNKITSVWDGDTITVEIPGEGVVTVTGVTFYMQGHDPVFTPTDGTNLENAVFLKSTYVTKSTKLDLDDLAPACFTPGTLIDTAKGPCPVQFIAEGDLVDTADCGPMPVEWIGRRRVAARGALAPVWIAAGTLGNTRDLMVSPQHRILIQGWAAELYAGHDGVLVPARHLVDGHRIRLREGGMVDYLHLGFGDHVLVRSEGIWTESHFASAAARREKRRLRMRPPQRLPALQLARMQATRAEAAVLARAPMATGARARA